jgi:hypothetical protein
LFDTEDETVRKTTMREVKILKMLKNPNIVNLIEAFRRKGSCWQELRQELILNTFRQTVSGI